MKRYNNYHRHDFYSNLRSLDCVVKPIEYIERAKELDGDKAILFTTNHGFQGNVHEYYTLAKENNIKLVNINIPEFKSYTNITKERIIDIFLKNNVDI